MDDQCISLANLGRGSAVERFDHELKTVIENILDPNTDAKKMRSLSLTVKFKPNKDRNYGNLEIHVVSKLAPLAPAETQAYIGRDELTNEPIASEHNPQQMGIPGIDTPISTDMDNVTPMSRVVPG